ncbi:MAG: flagellar filament capping protein FliD [Deltaproteobacteria bacterium]|nr:flagellar filament capping protein FliD [Deltaproteobacteria bacterium]
MAESTITFGGLASGLDTNAIIDGLMKVEALPLKRNLARQQTVTSAKGTLSSLLNTLNAVKTAAQALDTSAEFATYTLNSSDSDVAIASANGVGQPGSYKVEVKAVARETRAKSASAADATTDLGQDGDFKITVGTTETTIDVDTADSLADIAVKINASDAAVNASVVKTGSEAYLVITGKNAGTANAVTFTQTGTVALGMSEYQAATNARIVVDDQFTVDRSTNKFSDVIDGVTITAKTVSTTPVTVTVAADADGQANKIQAFVDAYNSAISAGHLASGWGSIKAANSALSGDSAVRSSLDLLAKTVSSAVPGLSGKYRQLASVGVSLSQDGSLKLDRTKLKAALEADPVAAAKVFTGDDAANQKGVMELVADAVTRITKAKDGILPLRINQFERELERLDSDNDSLQRRLDAYELNLRKRFTMLEDTVSKIQFQSRGLSGFTAMTNNNNR